MQKLFFSQDFSDLNILICLSKSEVAITSDDGQDTSLPLTCILPVSKYRCYLWKTHRSRLMYLEACQVADYEVGKLLWVKARHVFREPGIRFKYVFWEGDLAHAHWLVYQIANSFLAQRTEHKAKPKQNENGLKYRQVLMEAEGLGKDMEFRTLPRGQPHGKSLVGPGHKGKASGTADRKGWRSGGSRQEQKAWKSPPPHPCGGFQLYRWLHTPVSTEARIQFLMGWGCPRDSKYTRLKKHHYLAAGHAYWHLLYDRGCIDHTAYVKRSWKSKFLCRTG